MYSINVGFLETDPIPLLLIQRILSTSRFHFVFSQHTQTFTMRLLLSILYNMWLLSISLVSPRYLLSISLTVRLLGYIQSHSAFTQQ
jgi:hypothetical protein